MEQIFYTPYIPTRLQKFFNDYDYVINVMFKIIKLQKPDIIDSYSFSKENPPKNPKYKYTEKLYIGCIFYVLKHNDSWDSFIGPIPGKQLNKRHNDYCKNKIYSNFFYTCLEKYLKTNNIKYLTMDATICNNKYNKEIHKHLPINKNRKGAKTSLIGDEKGSPLTEPFITDSTVHDSILAIENINELVNNELILNTLNKTKGHVYLLADSAYDTKEIKKKLMDNNIKPIIKPNNRNTGKKKNQYKQKKKKKLSKSNRIKYKKRKVIENSFAIIKKNTKINCVYEKKLSSYRGLMTFIFGTILIKRAYDA